MTVTDALQFERDWETRSGSKVDAIRTTFGISPTRYFQQLYTWLDQPTTTALDPQLVARLRRLRDNRATQRASRNFGQTVA